MPASKRADGSGRIAESSSSNVRADEKNGDKGRLSFAVRIVWVALGLFGAILHALPSARGGWPVADLVTMAWLGFAALGVLLPSISSIDLPGGGGVKFREAKQAAVEGIANLEDALADATAQLQSWMACTSWLNTYLQRADVDDEAATAAVFRYCLERMEEAKDWMGDEDELIRISLWWQDAESGELFFMFSNDIRDAATQEFRFAPNDGLMGQAFAENRIYNLDDAPASAFYVPIRKNTANYYGLLLVPVRIFDTAVGIVSIDRGEKSTFSQNAESVAEGLAEQIAYAFSHPRMRTVLIAIPERLSALLLQWHVELAPPVPASTPSQSSGDLERPEA
jgi:hypothetical protein